MSDAETVQAGAVAAGAEGEPAPFVRRMRRRLETCDMTPMPPRYYDHEGWGDSVFARAAAQQRLEEDRQFMLAMMRFGGQGHDDPEREAVWHAELLLRQGQEERNSSVYVAPHFRSQLQRWFF